MYRDQKPPESVVTTETHARRYDVTLSTPEAHDVLCFAALRKVGITDPESSARCRVSVYESDTDYDGNSEIIYSVVITEDLTPIIPPPDEAPTNPVAFRLFGQPKAIIEAHIVAECQPIKAKPTSFETLNTTAASSRENVEAIERMNRITRLHKVLLHGKGHNIVLNRDEVDTLLEILEYSADA